MIGAGWEGETGERETGRLKGKKEMGKQEWEKTVTGRRVDRRES